MAQSKGHLEDLRIYLKRIRILARSLSAAYQVLSHINGSNENPNLDIGGGLRYPFKNLSAIMIQCVFIIELKSFLDVLIDKRKPMKDKVLEKKTMSALSVMRPFIKAIRYKHLNDVRNKHIAHLDKNFEEFLSGHKDFPWTDDDLLKVHQITKEISFRLDKAFRIELNSMTPEKISPYKSQTRSTILTQIEFEGYINDLREKVKRNYEGLSVDDKILLN